MDQRRRRVRAGNFVEYTFGSIPEDQHPSITGRHSSGGNVPRAAGLRRWTEDRLARWRGRTSGVGLETRLEAQGLFGAEEEAWARPVRQ